MSRLDEEFQHYGLTLKQLLAQGWLYKVAGSGLGCGLAPSERGSLDWLSAGLSTGAAAGCDTDGGGGAAQQQVPTLLLSPTMAAPCRQGDSLDRVRGGGRHLPHRRQEGNHS